MCIRDRISRVERQAGHNPPVGICPSRQGNRSSSGATRWGWYPDCGAKTPFPQTPNGASPGEPFFHSSPARRFRGQKQSPSHNPTVASTWTAKFLRASTVRRHWQQPGERSGFVAGSIPPPLSAKAEAPDKLLQLLAFQYHLEKTNGTRPVYETTFW